MSSATDRSRTCIPPYPGTQGIAPSAFAVSPQLQSARSGSRTHKREGLSFPGMPVPVIRAWSTCSESDRVLFVTTEVCSRSHLRCRSRDLGKGTLAVCVKPSNGGPWLSPLRDGCRLLLTLLSLWLGNQGSNLEPPDSESGALPVAPFPNEYTASAMIRQPSG